ncbi:MAG: T9SS type A sorting domain-containing protein [Flavobacteriales bacterium]
MRTNLLLGAYALTGASAFGQSIIDRYLTDPLTYTTIVTSTDQVSQPRDLDFKPMSNELWVMNKGTGNGGSMVIVHNAGLPGQTDVYKKDTHSSHFMIQASAMAFSENGEWAAVSEVQNTASPTSTFMGPALWSADPNIFATVFQNNWVSGYPLGSHLDMLHQSPFAMGIASDSAKVYWVMDGHFGNICRYDFVQDHGSGYDDHSAGKIWRYIDVPVTRVPNIPSHMVLDRDNGWLYFIDGGSKQIKRLNVHTGTETGNLTVPGTSNEPLASYKKVEGATVEIVDTWTTQPCGIDYVQGRLIVSDHTNGDIRIYDVTGTPALLGTVATGMTGIMGVKVGPDGRIWYAHYTGNKVVRIDPTPLNDDAAITAIVSPAIVATATKFYATDHDVCAASIAPVVTLANMGANDLMMVDIHVHLDGDAATMYSWTGTLAPGGATDVTLPSIALTSGAHQLNVWCEMPNGTEDMNQLNDELQGSFRSIDPIQSVPFTEGFTSTTFPPTGWNYVHFNPNNLMTRNTVGGFGLSTGCTKMDHYSGDMNITGQLDYLMMPRVDLSTATPGTTLDFAVAYRQYNTSSADRLMVKVSTDCGVNWSTLYNKAGSTLSTAPAGTAAFNPTATQWRTEYVDLGSVLGQPDVLFMFVTESNFGNNMYMDDVKIGNSVGMEELAANAFAVYPNPSNGHFAVRGGKIDGDMTISVFGIDGSMLHQERWTAAQGAQLDMDMSTLAGGSYVVSLTDAAGRSHRTRIVIQ